MTVRRQRESAVHEARAAERIAIARDLHDLVAHHMASISLRVGAARRALDGREPAVVEALTEVHGSARTALADLRRLVGTLRDPAKMAQEGGAALAEPGGLWSAFSATVERARTAGLRLDSEIDPAVAALDGVRRLAVLRVVLEGLTNVLKHAGAQARATLQVHTTANEVRVEIRDDGAGRHNPDQRADPGFGLIGMRERVELVGGSLRAQARQHGWDLLAVIPRETEDAGR